MKCKVYVGIDPILYFGHAEVLVVETQGGCDKFVTLTLPVAEAERITIVFQQPPLRSLRNLRPAKHGHVRNRWGQLK